MTNEYKLFTEQVWDYYAKHGRDLPWRIPESNGIFDPYKIMVSEIMLQQTQVTRVIPKYQEFLEAFPNVEMLAQAKFADVLEHWSGLGYNRRAKYLLGAAKAISNVGEFPESAESLEKLPGIGKNTAAAICVYAFNQPRVFIETNIRTVFIHHFFKDQTDIDDKQIIPLIDATLPSENYREWYWALMDHGSFLKATVGNMSRHSKYYVKQSRFEGSVRQLRAAVLKTLLTGEKSFQELQEIHQDSRLQGVVMALKKEALITEKSDRLSLS